jgi:FkbM family methyltransferase
VYSQLIELGFSSEQIIKYPKQLLATMDMDEFESYLAGYERAYDYFTDAISRNVILQRIRCYLFGTPIEKSDSPQYFERGLFELSVDEVFVDGGFFTGDTTEEFLRQTNGKFKHIYGFEPDQYCVSKVDEAILRNPKIEIVPKGLYSKETTLKFATTGGSSQASGGNIVTEDGANVSLIPVTSLDAFFANKNDHPTFIKLDIEGSEREALLGMRNVIQRSHPKLAICAYHKPEDTYDLYELIREFCADYKFYMRHYANYFWETVLYAV